MNKEACSDLQHKAENASLADRGAAGSLTRPAQPLWGSRGTKPTSLGVHRANRDDAGGVQGATPDHSGAEGEASPVDLPAWPGSAVTRTSLIATAGLSATVRR